jgi:hypothetical protein
MRDSRERFIALQSRADFVNGYWNNMKEQDQKDGFDGLQPAISRELSAMNSYLKESESSLKSGEAVSANRAMDRMEENLKPLEATAGVK